MNRSSDTYEGWQNRETWAVNLWLNNDYGLYLHVCELCEEARALPNQAHWLADRVEAFVRGLFDEFYADPTGRSSLAGFVSDVGSLWRSDWLEIARSWLSDSEGGQGNA